MRLTSFSVKKYRSIIAAERLPLGDLTILLGPNNEGKSNILRALVVGMQLLRQARNTRVVRGTYQVRPGFQSDYNWSRDFPLGLQSSDPQGDSTFEFEFQLNEQENAAFYREVRSNLNGVLPIQLSVNPSRVLFRVKKPGPGQRALTEKRDEIARFLSGRIDLDYVSAIRTGEEAVRVISGVVDEALAAAENDPEYRTALAKIEELQRPILESLSSGLTSTIRHFLPSVRSVAVEVTREARSVALRRSYSVIVDDGTPTDLRLKGDGVQSLAALSLARHATAELDRGQHRILAVEEPEAHLHPDAIHQLRAVLQEMATRQQVIVTTHCPVLVNRMQIESNILVVGSKAKPATTVREIRDALGVRTSDNLAAADVVLIVEGESDKIALRALLPLHKAELAQPMRDGVLTIETLGGGTNLRYKLDQLRTSLCIVHAYLDNDDTGRRAAERAIEDGLLDEPDRTLAMCPGLAQSEIEDMYNLDIYRDVVQRTFGVDLSAAAFRNARGKWSDRIGAAFQAVGRPLTDSTQKKLKIAVADAVAGSPADALHPAKRGSFDGLAADLAGKLGVTS